MSAAGNYSDAMNDGCLDALSEGDLGAASKRGSHMMTGSHSEARASGGSDAVTGSGQDAEAGGDSDAAADEGLDAAADGDSAAGLDLDVLAVDGLDAVADGGLDFPAGGDSTEDGETKIQPDAISLEVTTHLRRGVKRSVSWAMLNLPSSFLYTATAHHYCRYALYMNPSCPFKKQRTTWSPVVNSLLVPTICCSLTVSCNCSRMPYAVTGCSLDAGRTGNPDDGTSDCAVGDDSDEDCEARNMTFEFIILCKGTGWKTRLLCYDGCCGWQ